MASRCPDKTDRLLPTGAWLPKRAHKYQMIIADAKYSKPVWSCANCSHYMPVQIEHLVIGSSSLCWKCNQEFKLDADSMKLESIIREGVITPICPNCRMKESGINTEKLFDFIDSLE